MVRLGSSAVDDWNLLRKTTPKWCPKFEAAKTAAGG